MPPSARRHFLFVSTNLTWGGSEELWSGAAMALARQGHSVTAVKQLRGSGERAVRELRAAGAEVIEVARLPLLRRRTYSALVRFARPLARLVERVRLRLAIASRRPDLAIISQGTNVDGTFAASIVRGLRLRYVLVAQKATELRWPEEGERAAMRDVYTDAVEALFVSEHNRRLTEEQIGATLPNAAVVRNPFAVPFEQAGQWPAGDTLRLACVARLLIPEKGQDLLLRVLARDHWRERPLAVTFFDGLLPSA